MSGATECETMLALMPGLIQAVEWPRLDKTSGLTGRPVTITEHAGKLPFTILLAPNHGKVSQAFTRATRKLAEAVRALSNGAKTLDWINLQGSGHELATELAADIVARAREHILASPRHPAVVMVKLNVCRKVTGVLFELP